ncbi:MFS transporter [Plasticicumulans acidivorans]|uniref:Putative MFS family arabinose efflux permease n=1 Tax=Plasticicumulans acidivorans TaxID=886464 RepID=A0A317MWW0_9GAMM|nr:MFS transporter [Plasticicumulans acidivorans]PWV62464.1 putative MFS family arabinose efflux permease [Plasticicumulans acidivorans]
MTVPAATHAVLRTHPVFRRFWLARVATAMAYQMCGVAVGWQVYARTGSALALGLIGLVQFLPALLLVLVTGQVADRFDRRRVARNCQWIEGIAAVLLALGSLGGWLPVAGIYALIVVIGAARAFEYPAMASLLPALVPAAWLGQAIAASAAAMQTAIILGPALGGFLYALGAPVVYLVAATAFLLAGCLVQGVRYDTPPQPVKEPVGLASIFAGIGFIRSRPVVLGAISLDLFAVLLGGATALLPIYARDILHTGPWGLGLLRSAPAVGALLLSVWLSRQPLERHVGRILFGSVAAFGLATVVFALSTQFLLSLLALFALGAADMVSVVVRGTLVQLETPDAMRGRVSAVNSVFIGASNQLGEFESGVTAALLGVVPAVLLGGLGTLLVVVLWIRWFPELLHRERLAAEPA